MFSCRTAGTSVARRIFLRLTLLCAIAVLALSSCDFALLFGGSSSSGSSTTATPASSVAAPAISPASGSYASAQTVTITDTTAGATIYYTTDGTTPTTASPVYMGAITVAANGSTTVEAIAAAAGMTTSAVVTRSYTITSATVATVATPALSLGTNFYYSNQTLQITDSTANAVIYYTTDGTSPVTSSTRVQYAGPITISGAGTATTVTAYATESGLNPSTTTSATYTMSLFSAAQNLFPSSTVTHIAAGDLNGDGETDLVGVESNGTLQVYLQSGGVLQAPVSYPAPAGASTAPTSIAVGDLNGDGLDDVAVGYGNSSLIAIYEQTNTHTFGAPSEISTPDSYVVRIGDVTGDNRADLVGLAWPASTLAQTNDLAVYAQQSGGGLASTPVEYTVQEAGYPQMAIGDVSNDGRNDVVVMSGQGTVPALSVLTQASTGTLNAPATYSLPVSNELADGLAIGDVNGDGLNDVVLSFGDVSATPQLAVYLQNSSGTLTTPTSGIAVQQDPANLAVLDVNGDSRADIVAANNYNFGLNVYLQQSNGNFTQEAYYAASQNFGSFVTGDFNGDGKIDLAGSITSGTDQGIVLFTHR